MSKQYAEERQQAGDKVVSWQQFLQWYQGSGLDCSICTFPFHKEGYYSPHFGTTGVNHKGSAFVVRRKARDGKLYSWKQFLEWYGGISWGFASLRWEEASGRN